MVDGIRVTNPTAFSSEFYIDNLMIAGVEKIEIIRGPQSGVYGTDAMAGVLNVITKKGLGPPQVNAYVEAGSFNTINGGGNFIGSFKNLNYNLYGSYFDSEGVSTSAFGPDNSEKDAYTNTNFGGNIHFTIIDQGNTLDNVNLEVIGRSNTYQKDTDQSWTSINYNGIDVPWAIPQDSEHETEGDELFFATKLNGDLFNGLLQNQLTYSLFNITSLNSLEDSTITKSTGGVNSVDFQSGLSKSFENSFMSEFSAIFGYEYENESGDFSEQQYVYVPLKSEEISSSGIYANANFTFGLNYHLNLAGRLENNSEFGNFTTYRVAGAWGIPMEGTFRISKLRASFGVGFESPSLQQLYLEGPYYFGNPDLTPEYSEMWDVGVHFSALGNYLNGEITYYNGFANDGIFGVPNPDLGNYATQMQNVDSRVVMQGVETSFNIRPINRLNIQLNYTWAESILEDSDTQLFERPEHMGNLYANLQITPSIGAGITFTYRGEQFASYPSGYEMDGYNKMDLNLNYDINKKITLYSRINNITDTDYQERLGFTSLGMNAHIGFRAQF